MRIAIEAQRIFRLKKHGMDFVILEVLRQLQQVDTTNEYFVLVASGPDRCLKPTANMHIIEIPAWGGYPVWEQVLMPMKLRKISPDLLHCTSNTAPLFSPCPLVLTLHDIIFLEKQHYKNNSFYQNLGRIYRRLVVPRILSNCYKIITVSEYECQRIGSFFHLDSSRITAIHNGFSDHFRPLDNVFSVTSKYIDKEKFIFFLGNTDPKKNTLRTLQAYERYLKQSMIKLPLLIADLSAAEIDNYLTQEKIGWIKPNLYMPGYIDNKDLPAIYSGAFVFLYTSLRESFGIPNLECMACGTPVITSNTSAIPEVAGEGAIMVDPTDVEAIAAELIRLENEEEYYNRAVEYGLERVKQFSWKRTAEQTLSVYKELDKVN